MCDPGKLILLYKNAVICDNPCEQFSIERDLYHEILSLRNGSPATNNDYNDNGYIFTGASDPLANETNFSNMYKTIIAINELNVDIEIITKYDDKLNELLDKIENDVMWNAVTVENLLASPTPSCRIASLEYMRTRLRTLISNNGRTAVKELPAYEGLNEFNDVEVSIPNDFFIQNAKIVSAHKVLNFRLTEELNPHYITHPSESLLIAIIANKAVGPTFFSYGLRLFHLLFERIQDDTFTYYHMPVEFRSDGAYVTSQYHTYIVMWLRITLNHLTLTLNYYHSHKYSKDMMKVHEEAILFLMTNPFENGKKYKKCITPINLYYGMDIKPPKHEDTASIHLHPWYNLTNADLQAKPSVFNDQVDCTGVCLNMKSQKFDKACYTQGVREYIKDGFTMMKEYGLEVLSKFITDNLIYVMYNERIIHNVIWMRLPLSYTGYARSHKITDVIPPLIENVEHNISHRETNDYKAIASGIIQRLFMCGKTQTERLISQGAYPDSHSFRASISTYMTTKSSGTAPIEMSFTIRDLKTKDVKVIRQRSTSKAGRAMCSGSDSFDMSNVEPRYFNIHDYYKSRGPDDRKRIEESGLDATDIANMRLMTIGTRATTATRDIRGIYIISAPLHIALCAVAKPHVDDTSQYDSSRTSNDLFNTSDNYGASILTQFQDGSLDAYAPFVMATADRRKIIVAADCSAWDQHCQSDFIEAWFSGMKAAFDAHPVGATETYMFKDAKGLTLGQICVEIINYIKRGIYSMAYGDNIRIVETNFMLSGLLVTFLLNSLINSEITYTMLPTFIEQKLTIYFLLIAGDDIAMVFDADDVNAASIEELRNAVVKHYTDAGHKINPNKSVISNRNIEMAKIYAQHGFVFNDPYMQGNESEKNTKDDSRLTALRGLVHKQFDLFRRSSSNTRYTCTMLRLTAGLAYHLKIVDSRVAERLRLSRAQRKMSNKDVVNIKVKYYPPYAAVILPSAVSGGLGCSWTGTSLNEVVYLQEQMYDSFRNSIPIVDALDFSSKEIFSMAFLKKVIPPSYQHLIPSTRRNADVEVQDVKVTSMSRSDGPLSIDAGLKFRLSMLQPTKVDLAHNADTRLREQGIEIADTMKYSNAPYMDMIQFADTLKRSASANADDSYYNIKKIFTDTWDLAFKPDCNITLYKFYPLYQAVTWDMTFYDKSVKHYHNAAVRKPIAPDTYKECERLYKPRSGKSIRINLMGLNKALTQFTSITGAHVTPEAIMAEMLRHNMFSDVNADDRMTALLTSISGDADTSARTVRQLSSESHTWADMMMASSINATLLETLDIRPSNLNALIMSRIPNFPPVILCNR
nr:MAG: hypothetical protein [Valmbacken virus]